MATAQPVPVPRQQVTAQVGLGNIAILNTTIGDASTPASCGCRVDHLHLQCCTSIVAPIALQ